MEPASVRQPQDGFLGLGGDDQTEDPLRREEAGGEQQQLFVGEAAGVAGRCPDRVRIGEGGVVERWVGDYQVEAGEGSACHSGDGTAAEYLERLMYSTQPVRPWRACKIFPGLGYGCFIDVYAGYLRSGETLRQHQGDQAASGAYVQDSPRKCFGPCI